MPIHECKVFGPVPSRRLGRSLGVDLIPFKTCSYDCVYCQLGRTTDKTAERRDFCRVEPVLEELRTRLATGVKADYVTLSGSGEPTLFASLKPLIKGIKSVSDIPVAVLTNGSLLWDPDVREALTSADLVVPSLDAGDAATFERVNRPAAGLDFDRMVRGLIDFRSGFNNQLWLEVFLLDGVSDSDESVGKIVELAGKIQPNRVQLNTVARPPAESSAQAVSRDKLERFKKLFSPVAELPELMKPTSEVPGFKASREDVLRLLRRRPCALDDVAVGLDIHPNEAIKYLNLLVNEGVLATERIGERAFYRHAGEAWGDLTS